MESRTQALDKLAAVLERRLVSSKRGARFRFSACAAWSVDDPSKNDKETIPDSDVRQCRDAVKALLGSDKARAESVQRSTLRHLVLLKQLPSDTPLHDKRLADIVAELRKRLSTRLAHICMSSSGASASSSVSSASASMPLSGASVSSSSALIVSMSSSVSKTPRDDLGASIGYEESLRRRVLELEKELEDTKQSLEKLLRETEHST